MDLRKVRIKFREQPMILSVEGIWDLGGQTFLRKLIDIWVALENHLRLPFGSRLKGYLSKDSCLKEKLNAVLLLQVTLLLLQSERRVRVRVVSTTSVSLELGCLTPEGAVEGASACCSVSVVLFVHCARHKRSSLSGTICGVLKLYSMDRLPGNLGRAVRSSNAGEVKRILKSVLSKVRVNDIRDFDALAEFLVFDMARWFEASSTTDDGVRELFEQVFLAIPAFPLYKTLLRALRVSDPSFGTFVMLKLFLDPGRHSAMRLNEVMLSKGLTGFENSLVHLPSIWANAAMTCSHEVELLNGDVYYACLADAILLCDDSSKPHCTIARRMCSLSLSSVLARRVLLIRDSRRALRFLMSCLRIEHGPGLLRDLAITLDADTSSQRFGRVFRALADDSRLAREFLVDRMAFSRCPFPCPRVTLMRIVEVVSGIGELSRLLISAVSHWSSFSHVRWRHDLRSEQEATRLLLLCLARAVNDEALRGKLLVSDGTSNLELCGGITNRLGCSDSVVRRNGLVVAEVLAELQGNATDAFVVPRRELETQCDTDATAYDSDISRIVNFAAGSQMEEASSSQHPDCEEAESVRDTNDLNGVCSATRNKYVVAASQSRESAPGQEEDSVRTKLPQDESSCSVPEDWWNGADDWEPVDVHENCGEDTALSCSEQNKPWDGGTVEPDAGRTFFGGVACPVSVAQLLDLLRNFNNGHDGESIDAEQVESALRRLHARVTSLYGMQGVKRVMLGAAAEVVAVVGRVDTCSCPLSLASRIRELRRTVLLETITAFFGSVSGRVICEFVFGVSCSFPLRLEMLQIMNEAVDEVAKSGVARYQVSDQDGFPKAVEWQSESDRLTLGVTTRRLSRSLAHLKYREAKSYRAVRIRASGLHVHGTLLFFQVTTELSSNVPKVDYLDLSLSENSPLVAGVFVLLARILSNCGARWEERDAMCWELIDVCGSWLHSDAPDVRRALGICLMCVGETISSVGLEDFLQSRAATHVSLSREFASHGADEDADTVFAGTPLSFLAWLNNRVRDDPDVLSRKVAGSALKRWAQRLDGSLS